MWVLNQSRWARFLCRIKTWSEEACKDDTLNRHEEELNADEMTVEEGIVLLRDRLLELDNNQYLPNVDASSDNLDTHEWEIYIVAMIQYVVYGHVCV